MRKAPTGARRSLGDVGANHADIRKLSSPKIKNISLYRKSNQSYVLRIPSRSEGRIMIVTIVGTGSGGRGMRKARRMTRTVKACGPDTPLLVSSSRKAKSRSGATVARKPVHRGEGVISRKAIAQGMSDVLR